MSAQNHEMPTFEFQLIIAECQLEQLLSAIGELTAPFVSIPPGVEGINPAQYGSPIWCGQEDRVAYLSEVSSTCLANCWGLLARTAAKLGTLVVGAGYDPVEDHGELFAASGGDLIRTFWRNPRVATAEFSRGVSLPSEASAPLASPNGAGIVAAVRGFGFSLLDADDTLDVENGRWAGWKGDLEALLSTDEWRRRIDTHIGRYPNPTCRPPAPVIRVRPA